MIPEVLTEGIPVAALLVLVAAAAAAGVGGRGGGAGGGGGLFVFGVTRSVHKLLEGVHGKLEGLGLEIEGGDGGIAFSSLGFNEVHLSE